MYTHLTPLARRSTGTDARREPRFTAAPTLSAFVRDAYDNDLRRRIDEQLDRQLAAFLGSQRGGMQRAQHAA